MLRSLLGKDDRCNKSLVHKVVISPARVPPSLVFFSQQALRSVASVSPQVVNRRVAVNVHVAGRQATDILTLNKCR